VTHHETDFSGEIVGALKPFLEITIIEWRRFAGGVFHSEES
jgi:hypothetical protein